jgi:hypothetical protein
MPTNYPTSLDVLTNPVSNDSLNAPSHSSQHANANDAIEAIEAKLGVGNANQVGLYHINSTDFTAASTVSVNGCFTSAYTRYRVLISAHVAAGTPLLALYFKEGTAPKALNYFGGLWQIRFDAATLGNGMNSQNFITAINILGNTVGTRSVVSLDLYRTATDGIVTGTGFNGSASGAFMISANNNSMSAFDGIQIDPSSSTMTGTIRIYGYRDSTV